jgi:SAM-dependent methyltransferase
MELEQGSPAEIERTMRELETINRLTLAYRPTLGWLERIAVRAEGAPLAILDVACGRGDMSRRVWRWAERRRLPVRLTGIDLSPEVVRAAEAATPAGAPIRYQVGDVFDVGDDHGHDVIMSSLFAHHLFDDALVRFVAWMERSARRAWLVNDLHRHSLPYHFVRLWTRLAGFGRFVVSDAPISVARGFTRRDWLEVLDAAGMRPGAAEIGWWLPFRYAVGRLR